MKINQNLIWKSFLLVLIITGCSKGNQAGTPTYNSSVPTPIAATEHVLDTALPAPSSTGAPVKKITLTPQKDELGFGVEITQLDVDFSKIRALGASWVRFNGVLWSDIEPQEGIYVWDKLAKLEEAITQANSADLNMILIVRSTPSWAQKVPGSTCSPILPEKLQSFAVFMSALTQRYNTLPLRVKYWELWNEPDIDPSLVPGSSVFGCWGDNTDEFYGGGYYAEMLKVVTPSIRRANPEAKIFLGGLLLDCDPTNVGSPGRCRDGYDLPAKFFEGILKSGGGEFIDFVNYHGYPSYNPQQPNPVLLELNMASWQARGGVVIGKANFLREIMAKYNVKIPLFLTETSFLCAERTPGCNPPTSEFTNQQAEYAAWLLVRDYAEGIGTIWFTFDGPGWRSSSILDESQKPKPVYFSLLYVASLLKGSQVLQRIDDTNAVGYDFSSPKGHFSFIFPWKSHPKIILDQDNKISTFDIFGNQIPNN